MTKSADTEFEMVYLSQIFGKHLRFSGSCRLACNLSSIIHGTVQCTATNVVAAFVIFWKLSRHADLFRELEEGTTHIYYIYNIQVP